MSHTPGPWELLDGRNIKTVNGIFFLSYGCNDHSKKPFFFPKENGWSELDANAKLIATAPELLEALKLLAEEVYDLSANNLDGHNWKHHQQLLDLAHTVINKATGGIV